MLLRPDIIIDFRTSGKDSRKNTFKRFYYSLITPLIIASFLNQGSNLSLFILR